MTAPSSGYIRQIDGLRAVAILPVMWCHFIHGESPWQRTYLGPLGVRLFFAISGFLITGILLGYRERRERGESVPNVLKTFYARRMLRIFPAYYLALAFAYFINSRLARAGIGWHLAYLSNWYFVRIADGGEVFYFWSLAVEEQFYLVWPLLILFLPLRRMGTILWSLVGVGALTRVLIVACGVKFGGIVTPAQFDSLGLGALLALHAGDIESFARKLLTFSTLPFSIGVGYLTFVRDEPVAVAIMMFFASVFFAGVVGRAAKGIGGGFGRILNSGVLVWIGTISYSLYLWHPLAGWPILGVCRRLGIVEPLSWPVLFLTRIILSFAFASASWYLVERPINNLKRYFPR